MAKAEAYYNTVNAKFVASGAASILKAIGNTAPGGSAPNRQLAQNANTAYEIGSDIVENFNNILRWIFNNWQIVIVGAVALLLLIKRI